MQEEVKEGGWEVESGRRAPSAIECAWQERKEEEKKRRRDSVIFSLNRKRILTKEEKKGKKLVVAAYREDAEAGRVHGSFLARVAHPPEAARNYEAHKVRPTGRRSCRLWLW